MAAMEKILHSSNSFSVVYDLWSRRHQLDQSYLGVGYSFLNENFEHVIVFLHCLLMRSKRHTGDQLAIGLAGRIDFHTLDTQVYYSDVSDNAKSVLKAGRQLLHKFHELVDAAKRAADAPVDLASAQTAANQAPADEEKDRPLLLEDQRRLDELDVVDDSVAGHEMREITDVLLDAAKQKRQ
jgi:hypothetical protein